MSINYLMIKHYYHFKLWNIDRVYNIVGKVTGITEDEYKMITGFEYPNKK